MQTIWFVTRRPEAHDQVLKQAVPHQLRHRRGDRHRQEFQFGMNWSEYSRFVGDIFRRRCIQALLAFFLESTFIGMWLFGWGKLPRSCTAAGVCWLRSARQLSAI